LDLDPVLIGIRAVHFAATVLVAGAVFFRLLVFEPALRMSDAAPSLAAAVRAWQARLMGLALAVAVVTGIAWLVRLAVDIRQESAAEVLADGTAWAMLVDTQFGHAWIARLVIAAILAAWIPVVLARAGDAPRWRWASLGLAAGFAGLLAWAGHSGANPGGMGGLQVALDAVHLIAAGAWVGALVPLAALLALARPAAERGGGLLGVAAARRFSWLGVIGVGTLLATGLGNSLFLVGSVEALLDTGYGRLLVLKIALFVAMVAIAAVNRFRMVPRLADADAVQQLQRNSLAEALLGFGVVAVVAVLGIMEPAMHDVMPMDHMDDAMPMDHVH